MHFIKQLYNSGAIKYPVFSLYFNSVDEVMSSNWTEFSELHVGGWNSEIVNKSPWKSEQSPDNIFWFNINSKVHWQAVLYDVKVGNQPINMKVENLMFDSGSSLVIVPSNDYNQIMHIILRDKDCQLDDAKHIYRCKCINGQEGSLEDWPTISMLMGSNYNKHWIELPPTHYLDDALPLD